MNKGIVAIALSVMSFAGLFYVMSLSKGIGSMEKKNLKTIESVCGLFPQTIADVQAYATQSIHDANRALETVQSLEASTRTFDNTARAVDILQHQFSVVQSAIAVLEQVHPDEAFRKICHEQVEKLSAFAVDAFANKKLYQAFKEYVEGNAIKEALNDVQRYYLSEVMRDFKRQGLHLPDEKFKAVQSLKKEVIKVALAFEENISTDVSAVHIAEKSLAGCDTTFIANLERDEQGNVVLRCDYPTVMEVREHCTCEETRKQLSRAFNNRAYPANMTLLDTVIALRDELAKQLGFASYAALELDAEMVQTPARAETFIKDLAAKARVKMDQEFAALKADLPAGVTLDSKGRFKPWDLDFIKTYYKKKYLDIDEHMLGAYFPVEHTLQCVFDIYQRFLSLNFKIVKPSWLWHEDVQLIEVRERESGVVRGYVFLDLYPRLNKYSHACHWGVSTSLRTQVLHEREVTPSVAVVIANFPKKTKDRPALLKHRDVETFFHEFGHAMHYVLGGTELASLSGTAVKLDFVEVPSQIFEEWMFDKQLLKELSHHYQTGKPLPDDVIDRMLALQKFDSGWFVVRQCVLSLMSLEFYKSGAKKDTDALNQQLTETYLPHVMFDPHTHMQTSFGHLTGYGARYYSYMWSKVFALDLFSVVKQQGLVNPAAGKVFVEKILSKGGSVDPNILLEDYLGRKPSQQAFLEFIGAKA